MKQLPVLGIVNLSTTVNAYDCTQGLYEKTSGVNNVCSNSRFVPAQTQGVLSLFSKTARPHVLFTSQYYCGPEQPAGLSKEVCLYAGADWL